MGAKDLAADVGPIQPLPVDCAHSEASPHTKTRSCLLVSSPAKFSKHHFASVQAVPAQASNWFPHTVKTQPAIFTAKPIKAALGIHQRAQNKPRQDLQRLTEIHANSECKHTHHDALRSIEIALSISTAAWRIRTR